MAQASVKDKKLLVADRRRAIEIIKLLKREYPEAKCSLNFESAFQLLCATILSAQCTDDRVNKVTPALFKKYPTPEKMAKAPLTELESLVRSTNFFKNKAKALKEMSGALVKEHGSEVPGDIEKLIALRGVGRKTANVVLGNIFKVPGVVVDTHVGRLSRRLGFTEETDPVKVEFAMMEVLPREDWTITNHLFIDHGRAICTARRAFCEKCVVSRLCPKVGVAADG